MPADWIGLSHIPASEGDSVRRVGGSAVTFIQRFSDALNLDPHFHTLTPGRHLC
jgi:hypothetical protein